MSKCVDVNRFEETLERKVTGKELRRIELFQELYEYVKPVNTANDNPSLAIMSEYQSPVNKEFLEQHDQETYSKFMSRHYFSQVLRE
ncbi:MAG: hypothetical protein JW776_02635 [Candidatus Lokiarchaeota archaeon]|nr:hypothetical protein [Candidatus Lokiarchaeota archaeon]